MPKLELPAAPPLSMACSACGKEMRLVSVVPIARRTVYSYQCANGHRHKVVRVNKKLQRQGQALPQAGVDSRVRGAGGLKVGVGLLNRENKPSGLSSSEAETVHLDNLLDEALQETFPASDPIAITMDKPSKGIAPARRPP
jgi:hypothetical protein